MLVRTHLVITIFAVLLLISQVENKFIFVLCALIATYIPDIDSKFSKLGKHRIFRIPQFFIRHRGILHSFVFLIALTLTLFFVFPVVAFGFFIGYSLHLLADSFTKKGVYLFYPLSKMKSKGIVRTDGILEAFIFVIFLIIDSGLFLLRVF